MKKLLAILLALSMLLALAVPAFAVDENNKYLQPRIIVQDTPNYSIWKALGDTNGAQPKVALGETVTIEYTGDSWKNMTTAEGGGFQYAIEILDCTIDASVAEDGDATTFKYEISDIVFTADGYEDYVADIGGVYEANCEVFVPDWGGFSGNTHTPGYLDFSGVAGGSDVASLTAYMDAIESVTFTFTYLEYNGEGVDGGDGEDDGTTDSVAWEWTSEGKLPKALAANAGGWLFDHQATNANTGIYDALKTEGSKLVLEFDISVEAMGWWAQVKMDNKSSVSLVVDKGDNNADMWLGFENTTDGSNITIDGYALVTAYEAAGGDDTSFQFTLNRAGTCEAGNLTAVYVTVPAISGGEGDDGDDDVTPPAGGDDDNNTNASPDIIVFESVEGSTLTDDGTYFAPNGGICIDVDHWGTVDLNDYNDSAIDLTISDIIELFKAEGATFNMIFDATDGGWYGATPAPDLQINGWDTYQALFDVESIGTDKWEATVALSDVLATFEAEGYTADDITHFIIQVCSNNFKLYKAWFNVPVPTYTVTVTKGTADVAEAKEGDTVTVTADAAPYGKQFIGWTAEGVTLEDATLTEVSFTMPANNVTLTANYEDIPEEPDVPTEKVLWTYAGDVELPYTVVGANWCAEKDSYDGKTADFDAYYAASIVEGAELVITTTHTRWFNIFFGNVWNSEPANDLSFWFMLGDYDTVTYNEDGSATHVIDLPAAFAGWEAKATEEGKSFDPSTYKSKMMLNFQVPGEETNEETGEVTPAGELTITEMYIKAPTYKVSLYTPESEGVDVGTYAVGQTVSITAPAKEGMVFAGWNVLKGDIELSNANAATTTFKMPASNVVVEPTYESATNNRPGNLTSGGYVIMGDEYHALIGNGIIITTPHVFDANNVCIYCGHYVEPVADESEIVVEVTDPVEPSTEEEEDVTVEVEEPAEDTNPGTGLALAVVPMLIAAAVVVISKR